MAAHPWKGMMMGEAPGTVSSGLHMMSSPLACSLQAVLTMRQALYDSNASLPRLLPACVCCFECGTWLG
jgi:hypothetical protein